MSELTIGIPCNPTISTELIMLGPRKLIGLNVNGGMAGGHVKYAVEILANVFRAPNVEFMDLLLTESKREIEVNPLFVSEIEDITLYKQTHIHQNQYSKSPLVTYYYTMGDDMIVQGNKVNTDLPKGVIEIKACCC
jgi:hypothetical protein